MKKHLGWIVALFVAISLVFCFVGCKEAEPEPEPEQQAPITGDNTGNGGNQSGGGDNTGNGGNQSGGGNDSGNENLQNYKYSKDLWGKWKRIDNGQVYTISGDSIKCDWETFDNVELKKESENILVLGTGATAYRLFRTGGGTRSFTAKVAGFQDVVSRGPGDSEMQGKKGVTVNRKSKDITSDTGTAVSGDDGTITFEDVVADEVQIITVETESGKTIEVELKPSYDGEDVGTIPIVESGYSFKTTYSIGDSEWYNDNQQLYCFGNNFKEYYLTFRFTNIGDDTCKTAAYELLYNDPQLKLSTTSGAISSITPGGYKDVTVKVSYGDLDEYYKDVTIAIKITDSKLRKTWLDSITLRFYQTPISLNMYAYGANKTGQLNGFVICPDGRSEYFDACHDWAINKLVPYNKNGSNDYTVVFSATDANNEMAYTLNARHCQNFNQDKFDFEPVFASSELFDFVDSYEDGEGNNTEDTAVEFEDSMETIKSYVQYGDIDYFKLNLYDVLFSRIEEIKIPKAGVGASAKTVQAKIKGKNFKSPLENVTLDCKSNFIVGNLNKRIIDDETMYVDLQIPSNDGDYEVTAKSEFNDAKSTFEVKEYEVETGDYVLKDNRIVRQEYITELTDKEKEKIFGVISIKDTGEPVIVGLKQGESLVWAPDNTTGHCTVFNGIITTPTDSGYDDSTGVYSCVFYGDWEGSDNWEEVCKADPEGSKNAAINYPVFNFANTYGAFAGLEGTYFEDGWYVPSIKELYDIYINKELVLKSLNIVGQSFSDMYWYWSSSIAYSHECLAYGFAIYSGGMGGHSRSDKDPVLVLHKFDPELFTDYEYQEPIITSVKVPIAGEGYTGELPVTIIGENLKSADITSTNTTFSNVTYINSSKVTATILCDGFVETSSLRVYCGTSSKTGTVKVIPKEDCFTVGDVVFTDGTRVKGENAKYGIPDSKVSKAFGIVASAPYGGGVGKIVGLKLSDYLKWSPVSSAGYSTEFVDIEEFDIDGSDNWEYVCSIDPAGTQDASVDYPIFNFANTYGETAKLTGTDYAEGWYVPTIAELYDVYQNKDIVQASLTKLMSFSLDNRFWSSSQDSYVSQSLGFDFYQGYSYPHNKDNTEKVLVIQQFEVDEFTLYEYPQPNLTSVDVQIAGEGYKGKLPVTIIGENIKGYEITCNDSTFANLTYLSDSKATATIYCDGTVRTDDLIVTCGSDSAIGTVKVISSSKCFTNSDIGKIIIEDGSLVSKNEFDSSTMTAVAVAAALKYNGTELLGLGLQRGENLQWAPDKTVGYETDFVGIKISQEQTDYDGNTGVYSYKFTGDLDGKDNWEYICGVDPEGAKDAATNYPAFNFANTYGSTYLTGSNYEEGWFIPSANELYDIFVNKDVLHESMSLLGQEYLRWYYDYWTSSQGYDNEYSLFMYIDNRYVDNTSKYNNRSVLAVHSFSAE